MVSSSEFQSTVGEVITLPPRTHLRVAVMKHNDEDDQDGPRSDTPSSNCEELALYTCFLGKLSRLSSRRLRVSNPK